MGHQCGVGGGGGGGAAAGDHAFVQRTAIGEKQKERNENRRGKGEKEEKLKKGKRKRRAEHHAPFTCDLRFPMSPIFTSLLNQG